MIQATGKTVLLLLLGLALFSIDTSKPVYAADVNLAWDAKTDTGLAGYKLYYGNSSRSYGTPITVGNRTSYTVANLGNGTHYFAVTAYYTSGAETGYSNEVSRTIVPPVDINPPVLSAIQASGITTNSTALTWTSSEPSDTQVEYGITTSLGAFTSLSTSMVTAHSISLSGLNASTTYYYRVRSRDSAGNLSVSSTLTFVTSADPRLPAPSNVTVR